EYDKRKDRRFCNLRGLNLKFQDTGSREGDPSMFRELYSYDLLNRMGVYAPKTGVGKVLFKINESDGSTTEKYFGIYTLIEPIDKSFLTRRYGKGENDGNLYKCLWQQNGPMTLESTSGKYGIEKWETNYRPGIDLTTNDDKPDFTDIQNFVSKTKSEGITYLEKNFEIDRFLRWLAANMLIGMPDDYWSMGNNYYLYFNNVTGKCEFIPYDYDHGLGGGWDGGVGYDAIKNANIEKWFYSAETFQGQNGSRSKRPLIDKILSNPTYLQKYKNYLKEFIDPKNKLFNYDDYLERFNKVKNLVSSHLSGVVYADSSITLSMKNESFVKDYFDGKIASVSSQLNGTSLTTTTTIKSTTTTTVNLGYTSPEITGDNVIFRYKYSGANSLVVRGSFNGWSYDTTNWKMTDSDSDGIYELTKLKSSVPNDSRYKFFFGTGLGDDVGTWSHDPANPNRELDGAENSIIVY
ncbi:MAG TPA: CotH kinase family protein, partial [Spirochaetota bacterium]|nr:CotH kinase family protein [Spirochaetota bacterium]